MRIDLQQRLALELLNSVAKRRLADAVIFRKLLAGERMFGRKFERDDAPAQIVVDLLGKRKPSIEGPAPGRFAGGILLKRVALGKLIY